MRRRVPFCVMPSGLHGRNPQCCSGIISAPGPNPALSSSPCQDFYNVKRRSSSAALLTNTRASLPYNWTHLNGVGPGDKVEPCASRRTVMLMGGWLRHWLASADCSGSGPWASGYGRGSSRWLVSTPVGLDSIRRSASTRARKALNNALRSAADPSVSSGATGRRPARCWGPGVRRLRSLHRDLERLLAGWVRRHRRPGGGRFAR